jgi:hypothetical protein
MAIRARVGRHTQLGGRHCQNWSDDQRAVIDLLNRISPPNGGAGGSLHPRIVAGIASAELYSAIVAFENRHFPGQRGGFVEPGSPMYQRLEALAAAAAAPAPVAAPPAPPAAVTIPHYRGITGGERTLLRSVFEETLPYESLVVDANTANRGGVTNSITPVDIPYFSTTIWCADFSAPTVSVDDRGIFIHEFTHVWQSYHGITKISAIGLWVRYRGDYDPLAYRYDLSDSDDFRDYNIEQQASIIEDWWYLTVHQPPKNNRGRDRSLSSYNRYVDQVRSSGPPQKPVIWQMADNPFMGG